MPRRGRIPDRRGGRRLALLRLRGGRERTRLRGEPRPGLPGGRAFGAFQRLLVDLPGGRLVETIPDFHNTLRRFENLRRSVAADPCNRASGARAEIDFFESHAHEYGEIVRLMAAGRIPERVTHNDTKLNNVLIDDATGEGLCVIDLDTCMPGSALYDFGDLVRTSTSPAAEDERDLSKVRFQEDCFEALARGYLGAAGDFLAPAEREHLAFAGKLITMEIGMRFLADHLDGDVYFKTARPAHNLDRCRTQIRLAMSIEQRLDSLNRLVAAI
ncbi:MAG: aminoglycoside phosphotransferase family protein [Kiritimatiellia bacterium]